MLALPDQTDLISRTCWFCGEKFWASTSNAQYCTPAHKQKAYRWRTKVTQQKVRAFRCISQLAQYLDYEPTTPAATLALSEIRTRIVETLLEKKVQVVK